MDGERGAPNPKLRDAVKYILGVKRAFRDEPEKYDEFIQIVNDVRAHRVDEDGGKARVKELMKGHRELLMGFNLFFPGAEIAIPPQATISFEDTRNFIQKLKARFQGHDSHVYKSFLEILKTFKEGNMSGKEVETQILRLLQGHQDLIEDVSIFFPDAEITIQPEAEKIFEYALNLLEKIMARFPGDDSHVYESFLEILKTYREGNMSVKEVQTEVLRVLRGHQDLIEEVSIFFS